MSESYSVVIPAYNAELTIKACLESVLAQTLLPLQVLVIDDESTDGTEAEALRCKEGFAAAGVAFEYFRLAPNVGPAAARNKGIRAAKGTCIAFLDADDCWAADKLAVVDRFSGDHDAGLVCHAYTERTRSLAAVSPSCYEYQCLSIYSMLLRNPAQTSCAVVRKTKELAFDESFRLCEDYDLWMRIAEHSRVLRIVGAPLARLGRPQLSAGGLSGDTLGMRAGELRVYINFCRRNWPYRALLLPLLMAFSVLKHGYSWLCRLGR